MINIEKQLADNMASLSAQLSKWVEVRGEFTPLLSDLGDAFWHASTWGNALIVHAAVNKDELTEIIKKVRSHGWDWTTTDRPPEKFTGYTAEFERGDFRLRVVISSKVCKKVQVGTEMKEVPIYDIVCDQPFPETDDDIPF